ncbi:MAG: hypothetical protein ACRDQF_10200 [Thermocrispum sp.]
MSYVSALLDVEADWAADGSMVITAIEGSEPMADRVTMVLGDEAVDKLRVALARPKTDRQGFR